MMLHAIPRVSGSVSASAFRRIDSDSDDFIFVTDREGLKDFLKSRRLKLLVPSPFNNPLRWQSAHGIPLFLMHCQKSFIRNAQEGGEGLLAWFRKFGAV
jgi:hypothetical protein